jgi:hypothetical protein
MSRKNGGIIGPANTPVGGIVTGVAGGVWRMNDLLNFVGNSQWPKTPENIENSCRFDDGSSDSLTRTFGSAGNKDTFTLSAWVKRAALTTAMTIFGGGADDNNRLVISFGNSDDFRVTDVNSGSGTAVIATNRLFRDVSAWYHIVVAYDTTQSTDSDRVKLYVNGVQETSFASTNYPSQNADQKINGAVGHFIASNKPSSPSNYFDGYMAEVVFIDGQQLTPSSFGETDSTTGIWKPKKIGQIANAGTNSFYLNFKDSSNVGKDESGLNNNFTVNNLTSIDQSTDTCVENFCTQHPLSYRSGQTVPTYSDGNLKAVFAAGVNTFSYGTLGVQAGKWYWEVKVTFGSNVYTGIGFASAATNTDINGYLLRQTGQKYNTSGSASSYASALSTGDTVMVAFDADNGTLWFGVNGTWSNSATQSEIENGTTSNSAFSSIDMSSIWLPLSKGGTSSNSNIQANFGNPIYSISSGNSDANGFGNFEYAVPSGYYALNTSNLNTYG